MSWGKFKRKREELNSHQHFFQKRAKHEIHILNSSENVKGEKRTQSLISVYSKTIEAQAIIIIDTECFKDSLYGFQW